jgi:hypothetical protein
MQTSWGSPGRGQQIRSRRDKGERVKRVNFYGSLLTGYQNFSIIADWLKLSLNASKNCEVPMRGESEKIFVGINNEKNNSIKWLNNLNLTIVHSCK